MLVLEVTLVHCVLMGVVIAAAHRWQHCAGAEGTGQHLCATQVHSYLIAQNLYNVST